MVLVKNLNKTLLVIFIFLLLVSSVLLYYLYKNRTGFTVINSFADEEAVSYSKDELDKFIATASKGEIGNYLQIELIQGFPQREKLIIYNSKYPLADPKSAISPSEQNTYEVEVVAVGCAKPESVVEKGKERVRIRFYIAKSALLGVLPPDKADEVINAVFRRCLAYVLKGEKLTSEQFENLMLKLHNEFGIL